MEPYFLQKQQLFALFVNFVRHHALFVLLNDFPHRFVVLGAELQVEL